MKMSAHLGFLYRDRPLADAIRAAHADGFGAVELHWPYEDDAEATGRLLRELGIPLLGINTSAGDPTEGEFGLCALPGRTAEARVSIDAAVDWARRSGARNVHVMAGRTEDPAAFSTFADNLSYAVETAGPHGIGILIEPLNPFDVPGYFLLDLATALALRAACGPAVRLMFDCYHLQITHGDLLRTARTHLEAIGHVQFAAVPDRAEPDHGEVDFCWLLPEIEALNYAGWFGAEYRPQTGSMDWLPRLAKRAELRRSPQGG